MKLPSLDGVSVGGGYVCTTLWLGQCMKLPSLGGVSVGEGCVRTTLWLGQHMKLPSLGGVSVGEGCVCTTLWLGQCMQMVLQEGTPFFHRSFLHDVEKGLGISIHHSGGETQNGGGCYSYMEVHLFGLFGPSSCSVKQPAEGDGLSVRLLKVTASQSQ